MLMGDLSTNELTTEFITSNIHLFERPRKVDERKVDERKSAKKREKPREFFSFFLDSIASDVKCGRDEFRARQLVATTIGKARDRLKACGIKDTTACPDLLQKKPLQPDAIAAVCVVYNINCILLSGKLAFRFAWGTTPEPWLILERHGSSSYTCSKLSTAYISENYIETTSATKPLYSIGKYSAADVKHMWGLCEFGCEEPKTKRQAFDALAAYVDKRTKSAN
jgi:hypothetical protein